MTKIEKIETLNRANSRLNETFTGEEFEMACNYSIKIKSAVKQNFVTFVEKRSFIKYTAKGLVSGTYDIYKLNKEMLK